MPLKTTINVDVEKAQFEESFRLFEKYREALKEAPGQWAHYQHRIQDVDKAAKKLSTLLEANRDSLDETVTLNNRFTEAAAKAGQIFHRLALNVKDSAEHLASLTTSLFRFSLITGTISGLLGSGFGVYVLDHTAQQVMARRRSALGMGVPYGSLQSFDTNFGRFGIGAETVGAVSSGLYDFTSPQYRALVAGAGLRGNRNAADTTVNLLRQLPSLFAGVPDGMIGPRAQSLGLTDIFSLQQIIAYLKASKEEREAQIEAYSRDKAGMDIPPDAAKKWADFATAVDRAGTIIENVMTNKLTGLTPYLTRISKSAQDLIVAFADSGAATRAVDALGKGLNWLGDELGKPETKEAGKKFLTGVEALFGALVRWGRFLGGIGRAAWDLYNGNPTWGDLWKDLTSGGGSDVGPDRSGRGWAPSRHPYPSIRYGTWGGPGTIPPDIRGRMGGRGKIETSSPMGGSESTTRGLEAKTYVLGGYSPVPAAWTTESDRGFTPVPQYAPATSDALIGVPGQSGYDISNLSNYRRGDLPEIKGFIWHHSGGRGSPEGVVQTLNNRGLGVQWVMDRNGQVYRTLPSGARGAHIKNSEINDLTNYNTEGMEIIANDDSDITEAQRKGIANFTRWYDLSHPGVAYFGHGQVNPHDKLPTEGKTAREISEYVQTREKDDPSRFGGGTSLKDRLISRFATPHRHILDSTTQATPVPVVIDNSAGNTIVSGSTAIPQ